MDNFYLNPPTFDSVRKKIAQIKKNNHKIKLFCIGKSILNRRIYALGIGNLKNSILFTAAIHAQEWLTCSLLIRFFEELSEKHQLYGVNLNDIFSNRGLIIVPMCNPDGVEIALKGPKSAKHLCSPIQSIMKKSNQSWQANARGVDLNHNFNAGWKQLKKLELLKGIKSPAPRQYGGICPQSEPETKALVSLCNNFDIKKLIAFHSQGEEIYYHYGKNTPPESALMADALAASSGYKVCKPTGLASHGGLKDWFICSKHRPGFTIEIGKGINPLPIDMLNPIYDKLKEMLVIATLL